MEGTPASPGVARRAVDAIFDSTRLARAVASVAQQRACFCGGTSCHRIAVRMLEVYQNRVRDLLSGVTVDDVTATTSRSATTTLASVELNDVIIREVGGCTNCPTRSTVLLLTHGICVRVMSQGRSGSTRISNVNRLACDSPAALHAAIELGASRRAVGSHKLNAESSRSHQVVQLELHRTCQAPSASGGAGNGAGAGGAVTEATDRTLVAVLNLVDLAGSERVRRTGVSGERLKEAQHINRSLSALGDVIASLKRASRSDASGAHVHVPFRNAKLTHLLRDSLMGDSKVRAATLPHLRLLVVCAHTRRCCVSSLAHRCLCLSPCRHSTRI